MTTLYKTRRSANTACIPSLLYNWTYKVGAYIYRNNDHLALGVAFAFVAFFPSAGALGLVSFLPFLVYG